MILRVLEKVAQTLPSWRKTTVRPLNCLSSWLLFKPVSSPWTRPSRLQIVVLTLLNMVREFSWFQIPLLCSYYSKDRKHPDVHRDRARRDGERGVFQVTASPNRFYVHRSRMKKIQAKKKRDRAEAAENAISAPEDGKTRSMFDNDDDLPVLFT